MLWLILGANASNLAASNPAVCREVFEHIIERYRGAYTFRGQTPPKVVLQTSHAGPSMSAAQHDAYAGVLYTIAYRGTTGHDTPPFSPLPYDACPPSEIRFVNVRQLCIDAGAVANGWDADGVWIDAGAGGT